MSLEFLDQNGNTINSSSIKQILSDLSTTGSYSFKVRVTENTTKQPGIYLTPASNMGEVSFPSLNSAHTDYSDILLLGSNTQTTHGLSVIKVDENDVEEEVRFSFSAGSTHSNKILLPQLFNKNTNSEIEVKLKFRVNQIVPARRFYVGVHIDDSQ